MMPVCYRFLKLSFLRSTKEGESYHESDELMGRLLGQFVATGPYFGDERYPKRVFGKLMGSYNNFSRKMMNY